jgi:predicted transcriptional regulator
MKYTQQDIARILGVTPMTIRNWRTHKPKLYEIIMKGFAFEEFIEKSEQNLSELKKLQQKYIQKE